jgi:hypothetical protein
VFNKKSFTSGRNTIICISMCVACWVGDSACIMQASHDKRRENMRQLMRMGQVEIDVGWGVVARSAWRARISEHAAARRRGSALLSVTLLLLLLLPCHRSSD